MLVAIPNSAAYAQSCARSDFEAVVDDAAEALRQLNAQNKPVFQELLRTLKDKRGWDHDVYLREATPFVQDEKIDTLDQRSQDLLTDIATLGEEGTAAPTPDCALLAELRKRMQELVAAQTAKWEYMFTKLRTEIDK
ncbi:MAG: hypothetical protein APF80_11460 [Alphaproteobacteria bacterium BRH_c36]|nr:MAG: hypothetical protein APF80_11460 [Alphaproteobacteria bacterium BRH_c36]